MSSSSTQYETKDSGQRVLFDSGFTRDTDAGKPRYDLIPTPMLKRIAELYGRGAAKYGDSNWQVADPFDHVQMDRFRASAFRHFVQWMDGESDEDHASAVVFNVWAYEWLSSHSPKLNLVKTMPPPEQLSYPFDGNGPMVRGQEWITNWKPPQPLGDFS